MTKSGSGMGEIENLGMGENENLSQFALLFLSIQISFHYGLNFSVHVENG
jgi:hypothetical protein